MHPQLSGEHNKRKDQNQEGGMRKKERELANTDIQLCHSESNLYIKKKKGNISHSQITCKINRWELMKGKLRQNQREATQSISVYISIYRSSFILIFKPTKSCKYNF